MMHDRPGSGFAVERERAELRERMGRFIRGVIAEPKSTILNFIISENKRNDTHQIS